MKHWKIFIFFLTLISTTIWFAVISLPDKNLHIVACNVGEGDAFLVYYQSTQFLIDGGKNSRVVDCLSKYMPFWDKNVDLVLLTHPDIDHFGGLIDVFKKYNVALFLNNEPDFITEQYRVLKNVVGGNVREEVRPKTGMVIRYRKLYLDIVWPSDSFLENEDAFADSNSNDYSVVANLTYGNFDALFTGDLSPKVVPLVIQTNLLYDVEYLKVPHHGSKNGLTKDLLDVVTPEISVISVGKNSYGHPHQEILSMLEDANIKILRTDEMGDVEIVSDGKSWWIGGS